MITSLQSNEIDIGIGLTEGWVAELGKAAAEQRDAGYKLVGTYVTTPLCWAISTGANRDDVHNVQELKGKKMGISRMGRYAVRRHGLWWILMLKTMSFQRISHNGLRPR